MPDHDTWNPNNEPFGKKENIMYHCMHCGEELKEEHIAPKECPDNTFLDRLAKSQWALFGSGGSLLYLCSKCHRVTPILSKEQVDRFIEYIKKESVLLEESKKDKTAKKLGRRATIKKYFEDNPIRKRGKKKKGGG